MPAQPLDVVLRHLRHLVRDQAVAEPTDHQLLEWFLSRRDEAAFTVIVERHGRLVLGVCRSILGHEQDAEDAFQATFLVLARKAATVRREASLAAWLHGVARRTALKARHGLIARRRCARQVTSRRAEQPVTEAALRELQAVLHEEVARLPEKYRAPFVLCCLEGKSRAETALLLGWKEGTLSGRLARARALLQRRLAQRGVALSAALCAAALAPTPLVRAGLTSAATQAALAWTTGAGAAYCPRAAALAQGVVKAMFMTRLKGVVVLLAILVLAATSVGVLAHQAPKATPPEQPVAASSQPPTAPAQPTPAQAVAAEAAPPRPGPLTPLVPVTILGTGKIPQLYQGKPILFTPDSKFLLCSEVFNGSRVYFWDVASGRVQRQLGGVDRLSNRMALSADATTLYLGGWPLLGGAGEPPDPNVRAYDVATGRLLHELPVMLWALAPDGKTLAGVTHQFKHDEPKDPDDNLDHGPAWFTVTLWDTTAWKEISHFTDTYRGFSAIRFSHDGRALALGDATDGSIQIWEVATGKKLRTLGGTPNVWFSVYRLAFSPDGKTLASTHQEFSPAAHVWNIVLWDWTTGKQLHQLTTDQKHRQSMAHTAVITGLAFTADGKQLLSTSRDGTCRFWDVAAGRSADRLDLKQGGPILGLALSPDGKTLALAGGYKEDRLQPRLFDLASRQEIRPPDERPQDPLKLPFETNDAFPDPQERSGARTVTLPSGQVLHQIPRENVVQLLDGPGGREIRRFRWSEFYDYTCSPDGKTLATRSYGCVPEETGIRLWDVDTGKQWALIAAQPAASPFGYRFSPDGRMLAVVHDDGSVRLWETASGGQRLVLDCLGMAPDSQPRSHGVSEGLTHLAFARDGRYLAAGDHNKARTLIWDLGLASTPLTERELEECGNDLQGEAGPAYRALLRLAAVPEQSVPFLEKNLPAVPRLDLRRLPQLIAELDHDEFAVRQRADRELAEFGSSALPALKEALAGRPPLEVRRRLEALIEKAEPWPPTPAQLKALRIVEVLERSATPAARRLLESLASQERPEFTEAARAALKRMTARP